MGRAVSKSLAILACLFLSLSAYPQVPDFDAFAAETTTNTLIADIHIDSHPLGKSLESELVKQVGSGVNFAGKYHLLEVGCGTLCQVLIAVDVETGDIVDVVNSSIGSCFQDDSKLLIVNPYLSAHFDGAPPDWAYTYYFELTENGFTERLKTKDSFTGECQYGQ